MHNREFPRHMTDRLYGDVGLTAEEMLVIDSPEFQRLHFIRQTGLLCYIWPSANHTRFEHCIGVLRSAQLMLDALERRSRDDVDKLYDVADAHAGQAIRFHQLDEALRIGIQRVVRLCGLVHDLGHGPFSHAFAKFAPRRNDVAAFLDDHRLAAIAAYREQLLAGPSGRIEHEATSCILFAALWADLGGDAWVPATVAAVLLHAAPSDLVPPNLQPWVPFIRDLLASAPIDADRLDYLRRDSAILGVAYGNVDPVRILKSILCVRGHGPDAHFRLGWRKSGLRAIESALIARFQMFVQVYGHKTLRATELMLGEIADEAAASGETLLFDAKTLDDFRNGYVAMSDEVFLRMLAGQLRPGFPVNTRARDLATRLLQRRLWKRIFDFDRSHSPATEDLVVTALREAFPESRFIPNRKKLKAAKDLEHGALLVPLNAERRYEVGPTTGGWAEMSPIIRVMRDEETVLSSIFVEPRRGPNRNKMLAIQRVIHETIAAAGES